MAFDPPGTWDSPGGIELFTTTNYIKAVSELIEQFGNKPTLLLGHSRGGAVSILASSNSHVIGIVLVMSSYEAPTSPESIKDGVQIEYRDLPPGNMKTKERKKFALPQNYFKDGQQYNPLATLKKCTKPKLLFSGTKDEFYRPEEIQEIYEAIPEPKMIHELNSNHDYRYNHEIVEEVNKVIGQYLNTYMW